MCGIVGFVSFRQSSLKSKNLNRGLVSLIRGAERRGKDASGYIYADETFTLYDKFPTRLSNKKTLILKRRKPLGSLIHNSKHFSLFLHSRMETHGTGGRAENNHPVILGDYLLLHNGIILNHNEIRVWAKKSGDSETDSESLLILMDSLKSRYPKLTTRELFSWATSLVIGANTFVLFDKKTKEYLISSSNGSMYYYAEGGLVFASEKLVVLSAVKAMFPNDRNPKVKQVGPGTCLNLRLLEDSLTCFEMTLQPPNLKLGAILEPKSNSNHTHKKKSNGVWLKLQEIVDKKVNEVVRCNLCLLPHTYPGLIINSSGDCNVCEQVQTLRKVEESDKTKVLNQQLDVFLNLCGRRVLVPFSGGRDSSFLLHKLKVDLGLEVTAFTYDWGFVTNTARENISRMCGELEIEHLLISADIRKKRENVSLNVKAWLHRPHPGVIPLFMAGDKVFFRAATLLQREYGFDSIVFGMNRYEPASFKTAAMGITRLPGNEKSTYSLPPSSTVRMLLFYLSEVTQNPKLLNHSVFDTLLGFHSYYYKEIDYINFFDYYPWNLSEIETSLSTTYRWQSFDDPMKGWRNGDATAPFYNLLYNLLLGYNENNVLIANLLREGQINIDVAQSLIDAQRKIDSQGVQEYLSLIKIDSEAFFDELLSCDFSLRLRN